MTLIEQQLAAALEAILDEQDARQGYASPATYDAARAALAAQPQAERERGRPPPDPEDDARLQAKIANNQWDHINDFIPVFRAAMAGRWSWFENMDCKYVELWIDMRDGGCLIKNRRRERISPAKLAYQFSAHTAPLPAPPSGDEQCDDTFRPCP